MRIAAFSRVEPIVENRAAPDRAAIRRHMRAVCCIDE
jgi:hypothetical protein